MKNFKFNNKGFTLIETVIAVAIVGLVITMAFSLLVFGQNFFSNSNTQYGIQNDGRITSSYLSKELRFATDIEIIDSGTAESEIASNEPYSYFYIDDGKLYNFIYETSDYKQVAFGSSISNSNSKFEKVNDEILRIVIESTEDNKNYDLDTEISLENIKLNGDNIKGYASEKAVKYKTEYLETSEDESEDEEDDGEEDDGDVEEYTVRFYDIENGTDFTKNVNHGSYLDSNFPSTPLLTGYSFKEWNTMMDGNGDSFTSTTEVTGDMIVYAQWEENEIPPAEATNITGSKDTFTLTYNKNINIGSIEINPKPNNFNIKEEDDAIIHQFTMDSNNFSDIEYTVNIDNAKECNIKRTHVSGNTYKWDLVNP